MWLSRNIIFLGVHTYLFQIGFFYSVICILMVYSVISPAQTMEMMYRVTAQELKAMNIEKEDHQQMMLKGCNREYPQPMMLKGCHGATALCAWYLSSLFS